VARLDHTSSSDEEKREFLLDIKAEEMDAYGKSEKAAPTIRGRRRCRD
jgi:hypothetical protein